MVSHAHFRGVLEKPDHEHLGKSVGSVSPAHLRGFLEKQGVGFYAGVPDSLLKEFLAHLADHATGRHVIAANEGAAVGLAAGYYLATGRLALVYMQNSGLGNAVNPLVSLADPQVYEIPMILLIGWRGEPRVKDEPQHRRQGQVTPEMLRILGIPFVVLDSRASDTEELVAQACSAAFDRSGPSAILVRKGTFESYSPQNGRTSAYALNREKALELVLAEVSYQAVIVSTTGKISREVFEYRERLGQTHDSDFLIVGSMGHASQIALGVALAKPDRQVFCVDGDGAVLMHMGSLAIIGSEAPRNLLHIVFNNGAHDSVGGQPTVGFRVDFCAIARACGYRTVLCAQAPGEISCAVERLRSADGPAFLEIRVNKGARKDLGRPTIAPSQTKVRFMQFLSK